MSTDKVEAEFKEYEEQRDKHVGSGVRAVGVLTGALWWFEVFL